MKEFLQFLKRIIRFGVITGKGTNGNEFWIQQMSYLGKFSDCLIVFPYGMHANLPADNTVMNLFWAVEGNPENKAGIGWTPKLRPDLEPGEVAHYHPYSNSLVIFRNNGDIDIDTVKDGDSNNINILTQDCNLTVQGNLDSVVMGDAMIDVNGQLDLTVGGDADINAGGDVNVNASNVNVDASVTNLGVGGAAIARVGDPVQVEVIGGSSGGTHNGTIIGGGNNTSI